MLYDAVEKLSASRGTRAPHGRRQRHRARVLRARAALRAEQRNTVSVGNEWLSNTTMKKKLAANEDTAMKRPDTPFPRHWRYYIVLKYVVLAAAVALALKYFGVW